MRSGAGRRPTRLLRLVALVLPLGLDTFAVAAALGVQPLTAGRRLRLSLLFTAFEGGMPLAGLLLGAGLASLLGALADYAAAAALIAVGLFVVFRGEADEAERLPALAGGRGLALMALGLSVSTDELAIGFSLGLASVPIGVAAVVIAAQAFIVSQLGFAAGRRVGERFREGAERLAGVALVLLGVALLVTRLAGVPFLAGR